MAIYYLFVPSKITIMPIIEEHVCEVMSIKGAEYEEKHKPLRWNPRLQEDFQPGTCRCTTQYM